jgi:hypothetical protein
VYRAGLANLGKDDSAVEENGENKSAIACHDLRIMESGRGVASLRCGRGAAIVSDDESNKALNLNLVGFV